MYKHYLVKVNTKSCNFKFTPSVLRSKSNKMLLKTHLNVGDEMQDSNVNAAFYNPSAKFRKLGLITAVIFIETRKCLFMQSIQYRRYIPVSISYKVIIIIIACWILEECA